MCRLFYDQLDLDQSVYYAQSTMTKSMHCNPNTREHLLATGETLSLRLGFTGMGLSELLNTAGVPKGSFYHYFRSKEAFGEAMLQRYFELYDREVEHLFADDDHNARQQLLSYYARSIDFFCRSECHNSCLAVKLSAEVSDLSEPMRHALEVGSAQVLERLQSTIERGVREGSLTIKLSPAAMAETLYALWLGASLRAKIRRSVSPLASALETIELLLPAPQTQA
jgi:TetR/AcrR family transcriptional repressor of nem operon